MTLRVATAFSDAVLESRVVHATSSAMSDAIVVRRCRDVVELRAVAEAAQVDVAVVDGAMRGLDRDVVARLTECAVRLVAVSDSPDDLVAIGVGAVVGRDLIGLSDAFHDSSNGSQTALPIADVVHEPTGRTVAVWGPVGAPGRTTVAIELAVALAQLGGDSLIVDLDTMGPSVAQLLGLIDDTSGLAAAVRAAARGAIESEVLASLAVAVPAGPRVLVGLPSPERWTELRPASTAAVLQCARVLVPWTVLDLGSCIEGSDLDWAEPGTPQRFGAARTALVDADIVLCVGRTDPIGLTRMLRELPKVQALAATADLRLVLNRTSGGAASRRALELVSGVVGQPAIELLDDARNVQRAVARGCPVSEVSPTSALVTGVEQLARELLSEAGSYHQGRDGAARTHRRLLRGTHRRHRRRNAGVV